MKTTFRIPDPLFDELRRLSQEQGQSLNATAIRVLWRGLGNAAGDQDLGDILGSFLARRATATYEPETVAKAAAALAGRAFGLEEALDWSRSER
jgi:hypothetical protein